MASIAYYLIYNELNDFREDEQLKSINSSFFKHDIEFIVSDTILNFQEKRANLNEFLAKMNTCDTFVTSSILNLGSNSANIITALNTISSKYEFYCLKENISSDSTPNEILFVLSGLNKKFRNIKFQETLNTKRGIDPKAPIGRPPLENAIISEVISLREKGYTYGQIVNSIGNQHISKTSVFRIIRKHVNE